jgi:DNA-binding phage protein
MKNRKRKSTDEFQIYLLRRFPKNLKNYVKTALQEYQFNMEEDVLIADLVVAIKAKRGVGERKANYYLKHLNRISAGKDVLRLSIFVKIVKALGMRLEFV